VRWRPRSKHPPSLPVGPSQASSLPWRTVGPSSHSAPENHDLIWSDRAADAAKHSTHMSEPPVRRVLYAREAFPVMHEVLRATYADSGARRLELNRASVNLAADRLEVSADILGPSTNDPACRRYKIRRPVSATIGQRVLSEARWSLPRQGQRKCQNTSTNSSRTCVSTAHGVRITRSARRSRRPPRALTVSSNITTSLAMRQMSWILGHFWLWWVRRASRRGVVSVCMVSLYPYGARGAAGPASGGSRERRGLDGNPNPLGAE
jgi:hypothetical protein